MTDPTRAIALNELAPIGQRIREREELINAKLRETRQNIADINLLARDQGADFLVAETKLKLTKVATLDEWRQCHCPNVPSDRVPKYKRVAKEGLAGGQLVLLLDDVKPEQPTEQQQQQDRTPPVIYDRVWGAVRNIYRQLRDEPLDKWPEVHIELTRRELEPLARQLWPERFQAE